MKFDEMGKMDGKTLITAYLEVQILTRAEDLQHGFSRSLLFLCSQVLRKVRRSSRKQKKNLRASF